MNFRRIILDYQQQTISLLRRAEYAPLDEVKNEYEQLSTGWNEMADSAERAKIRVADYFDLLPDLMDNFTRIQETIEKREKEI